MSQSKVDKRKYEKKNRAAIMKREKRKKILGWCIFGVLVGCILAATLGVKIFKAIPKYVEAEKLGAYVSQTWAEQGYGSIFPATSSDASDGDSTDVEDTDSDTSEDTASEADTTSETTTTAETDTTEAAE